MSAPTPAPAAVATQPTLKLSVEDLQAFRLRRAAVDQAAIAHTLVQEGYSLWCDALRKRYDLPEAFDINWQTGEIVPRPAENGA
jgi:hypothetical protein